MCKNWGLFLFLAFVFNIFDVNHSCMLTETEIKQKQSMWIHQ